MEATEISAWHLDLFANSEFPIDVGGGVAVELPWRLRLEVGAGWMPPPYAGVINDTVIALGGWTESEGELITSVLTDSLVLDVRAGWRPWAKHGFFLDAGASYVTLGAAATTDEILVALTDAELPRGGEALGDRGYVATTGITMLTVEVGWDILIKEHFLIRPTLGGRFTVGATASMEPTFDTRFDEFWETLGQEGSDYLVSEEEQWVHAPTVGLAVGWRVF